INHSKDSSGSGGNPAGIKALLSLMGIVKNELRLPLVPVTNEHFEEMRGML
ncbi:MAG: dihydrodipicolinate synthase family protein, partial [Bacteroidales bacterium]|nr:dihydrodipicolinate synthase family protein [Bacteroidales bacterium]